MDVKLMEIVPKLNENVVFYPFDNTTYLIQQNEFGHQLRISDLNYQLLLLVDGERNLQEIQVKLFQLSSINVPLNLIHEILFIDFSKWGVIHSDVIINERNKDGYLTLKFTLLKVNFLKKIVPYLAFLFNPVFFWSALVVMIFSLSLIFCFSNINLVNFNILNSYDFIYVYIIMAFSVLLHEIGHIAACHYFGVNYGSIGFGFYLFMPVCFADVTDSWKVPTSNRLIIDFWGGVMDLMFLSILLLLYYFFNFKLLLFTSIFIASFLSSGEQILFVFNPLCEPCKVESRKLSLYSNVIGIYSDNFTLEQIEEYKKNVAPQFQVYEVSSDSINKYLYSYPTIIHVKDKKVSKISHKFNP